MRLLSDVLTKLSDVLASAFYGVLQFVFSSWLRVVSFLLLSVVEVTLWIVHLWWDLLGWGWRIGSPFLRPLTSVLSYINKHKAKWFIITFATWFAVSFILTSSITVYWFLNWLLMPQTAYETVLHFNYTRQEPTAIARIRPNFFFEGQDYDVVIQLELPESQVNYDVGMFMVSAHFYDDGEYFYTSSRPLMVHYKSRLLRWMSTVFYAIPLLFGWSEEKQTLTAQLVEQLPEPFSTIKVVLSHPNVQLYAAKLTVQVRLFGFRYLVYNYPITSFMIGTSMICIVECFVFLFLYVILREAQEEEKETIQAMAKIKAKAPPPDRYIEEIKPKPAVRDIFLDEETDEEDEGLLDVLQLQSKRKPEEPSEEEASGVGFKLDDVEVMYGGQAEESEKETDDSEEEEVAEEILPQTKERSSSAASESETIRKRAVDDSWSLDE